MDQKTAKPTLPTEIWELIFDFLTGFQLKTVRLVGVKWNQIVRESPKIMDKFELSVPAGCTVQQLQQMALSRYTTVKARNITVETGQALPLVDVTALTLEHPWMTAREMVEMLCSVPRLKELHLTPDANFAYELYEPMATGTRVLNQLYRLKLDIGKKDEFLCIFQKICPKLRVLVVSIVIQKYLGTSYGAKLLEFIQSIKATLKRVKFVAIDFREESLLRDIMAVEGLELKTVAFDRCKARQSDIAMICQSQVELETFHLSYCITFGHDVLMAIAMNLPNLTELQIRVDFVDLQPVLSNLPHLKSLNLTYSSSSKEPLDLSAYTNPNLKLLTLARFHLTSTSLLTFFRKSPNINKLTLLWCLSISVRDILLVAGQLANLHELWVGQNNLMPSTPDHFADFAFTPFRRLRQLQLNARIDCQVLSSLLEKCPSLAVLHLSSVEADDSEMEKPITFMKNLTSLRLAKMPHVTDRTALRAWQLCHKLESLNIVDCANVANLVPERSTVKVVFK